MWLYSFLIRRWVFWWTSIEARCVAFWEHHMFVFNAIQCGSYMWYDGWNYDHSPCEQHLSFGYPKNWDKSLLIFFTFSQTVVSPPLFVRFYLHTIMNDILSCPWRQRPTTINVILTLKILKARTSKQVFLLSAWSHRKKCTVPLTFCQIFSNSDGNHTFA